jgi:hypothetical protein
MNTTGVIEFEYLGKHKSIEYSLNLQSGYAGCPMITLKGKNNWHYPFVRGEDGKWNSMINNLKWPNDFMEMLLKAFEEKFQLALK